MPQLIQPGATQDAASSELPAFDWNKPSEEVPAEQVQDGQGSELPAFDFEQPSEPVDPKTLTAGGESIQNEDGSLTREGFREMEKSRTIGDTATDFVEGAKGAAGTILKGGAKTILNAPNLSDTIPFVGEGIRNIERAGLEKIGMGDLMEKNTLVGAVKTATAPVEGAAQLLQMVAHGSDTLSRWGEELGNKLIYDKEDASEKNLDLRYKNYLEGFHEGKDREAGKSILGDAAEVVGIPRKVIDAMTDQDQAMLASFFVMPEFAASKGGKMAIDALKAGKTAEAIKIAEEAQKVSNLGKMATKAKEVIASPSAAALGAASKTADIGGKVASAIAEVAGKHPVVTGATLGGLGTALMSDEPDAGSILTGALSVAVALGLGKRVLGQGTALEQILKAVEKAPKPLATVADVLKGVGTAINTQAGEKGMQFAARRAGTEAGKRILTLAGGVPIVGQEATRLERLYGVSARAARFLGAEVLDPALRSLGMGYGIGLATTGTAQGAAQMAGGGLVIGGMGHVAGKIGVKAAGRDPAADAAYLRMKLAEKSPEVRAKIAQAIQNGTADPDMMAHLMEVDDLISARGDADVTYATAQEYLDRLNAQAKAEADKAGTPFHPVSDSDAASHGFFLTSKKTAEGSRPEVVINLDHFNINSLPHEIGHVYEVISTYAEANKRGQPKGEDLLGDAKAEWMNSQVGPDVPEGMVAPKDTAARFTEEDLKAFADRYNSLTGRKPGLDANGVPVWTPGDRQGILSELYADSFAQFVERARQHGMGVVQYAKKVSGSTDARVQKLLDSTRTTKQGTPRNLGESFLFSDKVGNRIKNDAAAERGIADVIMAREGSMRISQETGKGAIREVMVSPNEMINDAQEILTRIREASEKGDQPALDSAQKDLQQIADTGIFATKAKTPQQIALEAADRAKKVTGKKVVTPQEIEESKPFISDLELTNDRGFVMQPKDVPVFLSKKAQARRDAAAWKGIHDAMEPIASPTADQGMTIVTNKDGERHLFGAFFNEAQMDRIRKLSPDIVPKGIKRLIEELNPIARKQTGETVSFTYYAAIKKKGNIPKSFRNASITSFAISKAGNIRGIFFDRTTFDRAIHEEAARDPSSLYLRPFQEPGDTSIQQAVERFKQDALKYTENHFNELPGETGLAPDPKDAIQKKNALNGFFGISDKVANPLASENNSYRAFRLDRMQDIEAGKNAPMPIKYNAAGMRYQQYHFLPSVDEQGFYSAVDAAAEKLPEKMTVGQLRAAMAPEKGIKPEELRWMGFDDFLQGKGPDDKITKADVQKWATENAVHVEEVMKGVTELPEGLNYEQLSNGRWIIVDPDGKTVGLGPTKEAALQDIRQEYGGTKFRQYQIPGGQNYRELLLTLPEKGPTPEDIIKKHGAITPENKGEIAPAFLSSHFEEPNILAHIRFNDRTDAQGKKVLFIEEVQSDWFQAMRRGENVPKGPFSKTWHELAMKRILRYAAENGYDKIAWTTGEQQAARYDLSNQVKHIAWEKNDDGTFNLNAPLPDGSPGIYKEDLTLKEVEEMVGKDVASKIESGDGREDKTGGGYRDWKILEGENLKVGGEGMKGFYDKILPSSMAKIGKKWGAKVGETEIDTGGTSKAKEAINGIGSGEIELPQLREKAQLEAQESALRIAGHLDRNPNDTIEQAIDLEAKHGDKMGAMTVQTYLKAKDIPFDAPEAQSVHSMDITPQMRGEIMEKGQTRFLPSEKNPMHQEVLPEVRPEDAPEPHTFGEGSLVPIIGAVAPRGQQDNPAIAQFFEGVKDTIKEPPIPGDVNSTGVILTDGNGNYYIRRVTGNYGGYAYSFPKGQMEEGLTPQQNALKEAYEETGVLAELKGYVGDFPSSVKGTTRFYLAKPIEGHTADAGWETAWVEKSDFDTALNQLNRLRDRHVLEAADQAMAMRERGQGPAFLPAVEEPRAPKATASEKIMKGIGVDVAKYPPNNGAADWAAKKMAKMQDAFDAEDYATIQGMDTKPKSKVPNKYQKDIHKLHNAMLEQIKGKELASEEIPEVKLPANFKITENHHYSYPFTVWDGDKAVGHGKTKEQAIADAQKSVIPGVESDVVTESNSKPLGVEYIAKIHDGERATFATLEEAQAWMDKKDEPGEIQVVKKRGTQDPTTATDLTFDPETFKKVGGKLGSNPAGVYEHGGQQLYIKTPKSNDQAWNEITANRLYNIAGVYVPEMKSVDLGDGKIGPASVMVETKPFDSHEHMATSAKRDFATHVWLANWDAVGLGFDNQVLGKFGIGEQDFSGMTVDAGGSMIFRAQGEPKAFTEVPQEWFTLRNSVKNPQAAEIFGKMTEAELKKSAEKLAQVTDADIESIIEKNWNIESPTKEQMIEKLKDRQDWILKATGVEKEAAPPSLPKLPEGFELKKDVEGWFVSSKEDGNMSGNDLHETPQGAVKAFMEGYNDAHAHERIAANQLPDGFSMQEDSHGKFYVQDDSTKLNVLKKQNHDTPEEAAKDFMQGYKDAHGDEDLPTVTEGKSEPTVPIPYPKDIGAPVKPIIKSVANQGYQKTIDNIHAAYEKGDISAVEAIKTNAASQQTYAKLAHNYKLQVLAFMKGEKYTPPPKPAPKPAGKLLEGIQAPSQAPQTLTGVTVGPKKITVTQAELPAFPEFVSKNAANVAQNKAAAETLQKLALAGDLEGLRASKDTPSPKLQQYKQDLIAVFENKMEAPIVGTVPTEKWASQAFDNAHKVVETERLAPGADKPPAEMLEKFVVLGHPGVAEIQIPKKNMPAQLWETGASAVSKLPSDQSAALRDYTGGSYQGINKSLREGKPSPKANDAIKGMAKAAHDLPEGTALYRKFSLSPSATAKLRKSVGAIVQEPGFSSTSVNPGTWSGNIHFEIIAAPGAKGLAAKKFSNHPGEAEVIIPHNARYWIQSVKVKGGITECKVILMKHSD